MADLVNQNLTQSAPVATEATPIITDSAVLTAEFENAASVELQLILGTLKLEGTAQAITKEQANTLLPLWSSFSTLSQSMMPSMGAGQAQEQTTPPTVSVEAQTQLAELTAQIQSAMTAEQIQAITAMQITQETAQTIMQELGLDMSGPQQGMGAGTPPESGGEGMPPSDGQGGQPPSGDPPTGMPSENGGRPGGGFIPSQLIEMIIQSLQQTAGS